ncbi:MAG: hypothetical protein JWR01_2241, partial [Subtercola sp.]|nr:hypothetical protein [Subtercola sp.]
PPGGAGQEALQPSWPEDQWPEQPPVGFTSVLRPEPPPEQVVARYRRHGRALFWPTLALIVIAGAGGYFLGRLPEEWQNLTALGAAVVLALLCWLLPTLRWLSGRTTVTTRRVITVRGLVIRERQEASLLRGHDVTVRRHGLQALFRSADVTIHSGSEHPLVARDLPDAALIARALTELGDDAHGRG